MLGGLATITQGRAEGVVSHYDVQPTMDLYATVQGRDLGAVASDINAILKQTASQLPPGSTVAIRGQVQTMNDSYEGLLLGIAGAFVLIYLLLVVDFQSWRDPFIVVCALPAALAGITWILVRHRHHPVGAGLDRRDDGDGRRHRQQHPGGQFRARTARAGPRSR